MIEVKTTIKKLFDTIEKVDSHSFIEDEFYSQSFPIMIKDENSEWKNIKQFVKKNKDTVKINFTNGLEKIVANNHLIANYHYNGAWACQFAERLHSGAIIQIADEKV